jgi:hypothetical protein
MLLMNNAQAPHVCENFAKPGFGQEYLLWRSVFSLVVEALPRTTIASSTGIPRC